MLKNPFRASSTAPVIPVVSAPRYTEWEMKWQIQKAVDEALREDARRRAWALADEVSVRTRCGLNTGDVLPVCELIEALRRLVATSGWFVEQPTMKTIVEVCEDLATRNARRGYGAYVPMGPLAGSLGYDDSGFTYGWESWNGWLRDLKAALPADHSKRLSELQNPDLEVGRARLALLQEQSIQYQS